MCLCVCGYILWMLVGGGGKSKSDGVWFGEDFSPSFFYWVGCMYHVVAL